MTVDSVAAIEFLSRSDTRVQLLRSLAREQQISKQEVHDTIDASRTTIQRNLSALEDRGWISTTNSEYAITTAGEWVAEDFSRLVATVETAQRLGPLLELVDTSTFGFDPRRVDFTVTTAEPAQPRKMIQEHVRSISDADEMRLLLPEAAIQPLRATHERLFDQGGSVTLIVSELVVDTFHSNPEAREYLAELRATELFRFLVTEREIPYYLGRLDDTVEIGLSENGQPGALLSTTNTEVREWAQRTLDEYESTAKPVE